MERFYKQLVGFVVVMLSVGVLAYYLGHAGQASAQDSMGGAGGDMQGSGQTMQAGANGKKPGPKGQAGALTVKDVSLAQAQQVIMAALQKAKQEHLKSNITVVDRGGNLKAFARMDGAWLGSIDIAEKKAKTSRYFDMPTGKIGKLSQPGKSLYMIEVSNDGLITFPGGVPLKSRDGQIIGAVGVSGSKVEQDRMVARAGAAALGGGEGK